MRSHKTFFVLVIILMIAAGAHAQTVSPCANANRIVRAKVVALDHIIMLNRLGAAIPEGMVFALERDVVPIDDSKGLSPGNVRLRDGKRARPIVLRVNQYDCLQITFTNYLATQPADPFQPATRNASVHVNGMQYYSMSDDGAWVGTNATSVASPGQTKTYNLYATEQGTFLLYSMGAAFGGLASSGGGNQDGAQQSAGLFGAVHVEPPDAEWYRSQVTRDELNRAFKQNSAGRYVMNWNATFADGITPVLRMYTTDAADKNREIIYTDLTAVISGKGGGKFDPTLYPCNNPNGPTCPDSDKGKTNPNFSLNYAEPDRTDPYREFTIIYHEIFDVVQAFPQFYATDLQNTLQSVQDQFGINYGTGGIGAEILANRIGVGPMGGCPDCKYEEFFLDSWTVGDPAMVVDVPANAPCTATMLNLYQATLVSGPGQFGGTAVPMNPPNTAQGGVNTTTTKIQSGGQDVTVVTSATGNSNATAQINSAAVCNPYGGQVVNGLMMPQRKATKAFYPDDPSNVYHSYLNDNVKFRVLHGGTGFSHVHHQHAHQWLRTPNNNESTYLDSQLINPGSAYTLEITFGGSGNRNKTPGDSIFHCHFYPHFAGGMWSLWRVHDTFEPGTKLDPDGRAASGYARALPDAEIERGTPTPAIVPLPGLPMAPRPADVRLVAVKDPGNPENTIGNRVEVHPDHLAAGRNPGYPFFIPGISGVRSPHPPMDFAKVDNKTLDGGLPRHLLLTGTIARESHSQFDFTKDLAQINAFKLPEDGTQIEKVAMKYHEKCVHATFTPEGSSAQFSTNGRPPVSGAPYADPAILPFDPNKPPPPADRCKPVPADDHRLYKAAVFQTDLVFNKQGWHYPQSRMLALWEDVMPTLTGDRPPQPLFFRTDSDDTTVYWHTNLVPDYYELDDFQVRTPTDIIGQHIHLVKFDVTSSDGASNGWNYEDGTFSPNEVRARIEAINDCGGLSTSFASRSKCGTGTRERLEPEPPPPSICGTGKCPSAWWGAQTTVQRWMADPLKSPAEAPTIDRTLRTVFTHDHFGPSTHQQTGLYAAFLIEPPETQWFESETGTPLYTRDDGGPTSWNAVIAPPAGQQPTERNTYREFAIALQDFQLAYAAGSRSTVSNTTGWADPVYPIAQSNAAGTSLVNLFPQAVSSGPTQGTYTFNYRNEPLTYRLQAASTGSGAANATDPAYAFASITRNTASVNTQPALGSPINSSNPTGFKFPKKALTFDMQPTDPYTPLLRAYENDNVQVRVIVGAHMLPHAFTMPGLKWLFEPGDAVVSDSEESKANSGYRSTQSMGISEHFEFLFTVPKSQPQTNGFTDFVYMPDSSNPNNGRGIVDGTWGLMRAYQSQQPTTSPLMALPNNPPPPTKPAVTATTNLQPWWWGANCTAANTKTFNVYAQNSSITLNSNYSLTIPSALVYSTSSTAASTTNEPLLLRANSGDCIQVLLTNQFNSGAAAFGYTGNYPSSGSSGGAPGFSPSQSAGLNPALLAYDVATSSGTNIGFNSTKATVSIGGSRTYYWYAGHMANDGKGIPMEFGAVNLTPADPVMQDPLGLVGGIIIEPKNTVFCADSGTQFSGYVYPAGTNCTTANPSTAMFRELVLLTQDNLNTSSGTSGSGVTQVALNYRQEPLPKRFNTAVSQLWSLTNLDQAVSNSLVSPARDPATPVFTAPAGMATRLHLLHPGGSSDQEVFTIHGHIWQDEPFLNGSTILAINPESPWIGSRDLYGTNMSYSLLLPKAGGANAVPGDYLYRTHPANFWQRGLWGIIRVK